MKGKKCQMTTAHNDRPTTTITIEIPIDLLEHLKELAAIEGTEYQDVIICYAQQGVINNTDIIKRKRFTEHTKEVLEKYSVPSKVIEEIFSGKILY